MMNSWILALQVLIPLFGSVGVQLVRDRNEKTLARIAVGSLVCYSIISFITCLLWIFNGGGQMGSTLFAIYTDELMQIDIELKFDIFAMVFSVLGGVIAFMVLIYSRYYMHRDQGFKRYFSLLLLFFAAYNLVILSGNFETMFAGWEVVGITSFLMISFYSDRYLPVKNAFKILSIYRLGDIAFVLAMWMSHQLWHRNISFSELENSALVTSHFETHGAFAVLVGTLLLLAAMTKSAAFPFSHWLPRAMEGPTSSSAIFYGSLSLHLGLFVLLRTYPYWSHHQVLVIAAVAVGVVTALVGNRIAVVQPTVKTQIAYSAVTQGGIILAEIALGWHVLAMVHISGHMLFRTYQFLVSPSVLSYKVHNMYFKTSGAVSLHGWSGIRYTLLVLGVREWGLDDWMNRGWRTLKRIGTGLAALFNPRTIALVGLIVLAIGILVPVIQVDPALFIWSGMLISACAALMALAGFAYREDPIIILFTTFFSLVLLCCSVMVYHHTPVRYLLLYFSGVLPGFILCVVALRTTAKRFGPIRMNRYYGHIQDTRAWAYLFLLSCL
ncbi:MAG: hypothetical protein JNM00_08510, partial [Flavobacteriales bacterium]|nr:hypothetical protein [Flavobacteriales bacterium]